MEYKPVSWSVGEPFSAEKFKQMTDNDEVIQNLYLQTALGTIAEKTYLDKEGGATIDSDPAEWTDLIVISDVFLYPSRWIRVGAIVHGAAAVDRGTYIPFRVTMDGTEVLWMRTPDAALGATQKWSSVSGARVMQSVPGVHEFKLQLGNDYASASDKTSVNPIGSKNPSILTIDDVGGLNV
jgi:hypothetical protein